MRPYQSADVVIRMLMRVYDALDGLIRNQLAEVPQDLPGRHDCLRRVHNDHSRGRHHKDGVREGIAHSHVERLCYLGSASKKPYGSKCYDRIPR